MAETEKRRLTCKEVSILLSDAQDRDIGFIERLQLEAHLKLCEGCRHFQRQIDFLRLALRRHPSLHGDDEEPRK